MPLARLVIRVGHEIVAQIDELHAMDRSAGVKCTKAEITRRALRIGLAALRQRAIQSEELRR